VLDDIARGQSEPCDENERLRVLSLLDRLSVTERGQLGALLMAALRDSALPHRARLDGNSGG
jgi:hypothetical protein